MLGDANGDGKVTVADYIAIAHHIMCNPPAGFNDKAADANGDGKINVADYVAVAHMIMNAHYNKKKKKKTIFPFIIDDFCHRPDINYSSRAGYLYGITVWLDVSARKEYNGHSNKSNSYTSW